MADAGARNNIPAGSPLSTAVIQKRRVCDVIVVGAGPSGSATAALLAERGFDVALMDRASFPCFKPCAECVSPEAPVLGRGAPVYAEVVGYALTNDRYHMSAPKPDGRAAARATQLALQDAAVGPNDVGYLNAHGSSTPLNDATETLAIEQVFGNRAARLAVSGTKGYYGHALGASGAIEAVACAL
ncbi:MAG: NAD(P)-binding protein [Gemmatimonadales bacterium]|nr:NAD(P)-binding protein [Gemmatimonadales bacterium]NIQ98674.1 NAD(P)-binding protein [Gemmatimonadales bacterium]NIS63551.1 NAD(P)-binding protein [Gemmatimonadales bacterium]